MAEEKQPNPYTSFANALAELLVHRKYDLSDGMYGGMIMFEVTDGKLAIKEFNMGDMPQEEAPKLIVDAV